MLQETLQKYIDPNLFRGYQLFCSPPEVSRERQAMGCLLQLRLVHCIVLSFGHTRLRHSGYLYGLSIPDIPPYT
jgi:hypothetical protein